MTVRQSKLHYEWSEGWPDWVELHNDPKMKELKERCVKMLEGGGKGKGKKGKDE